MALLKGIERCEYISGVMDNIHYIIWVKDKDDNLIFANKTAFELFKKFSANDSIECPVGEIVTETIELTGEGQVYYRND